MKIPQLWNERIRSMVEMRDGTILHTEATKYPKMHGIYGGVEFGLEKFNLSISAQHQVAATLSSANVPAGFGKPLPSVLRGPGFIIHMARNVTGPVALAPLAKPNLVRQMGTRNVMGPVALVKTREVGKPITPIPDVTSAAVHTTAYPGHRIPGFGATPAAPPTDEQLQGVDLRLDSFDLSSARHVSLEVQAGSWGNLIKPLDDCITLGDAFWSSFDSTGPFKDGDKALLKSIFNPCLSDRRNEGDRFAPPNASYSHVEKLRSLVKAEETVRQQRKDTFCSKGFAMSEPGRLFPSSWTSEFELASGHTQIRIPEGRPLTALTERFEYRSQAAEMLQGVLKTAAPVFDKSTEDGLCFRIYRLGSLEVRTMQEIHCEESIVAIFSLRDSKAGTGSVQPLQPHEKIRKATEYVERAMAGHRRYYIVLETEGGQRILTERHQDGRITWEADPENLDERNSLAKVTRSNECSSGTTIHDLELLADGIPQKCNASPSICKQWARSTYFGTARG